MKRNCSLRALAQLLPAAGLIAGLMGLPIHAHDAEPVQFSPIGIPYAWRIELSANESTHTGPAHVGAWSWDEDSFPETAKGWTHTSAWVQLDLTEPVALTLTLESAAGVPWPSAADPTRLAGTNLFPSFSLYRGWDTDAGTITNADGTTLDQDHTFNNRGNIEWAEDVTYMDHLDNSKLRQVSRTWSLPAGRYTVNLGGNSPATLAEGRQGIRATFSTTPATGFTLESHSALQAVNEQGVSTWTGTHPFVLTGVLLNNPEDFLDATPGFLPFTPANTFQLGGQWQVFFQSVDPADRGGTAGWMGQNYGNLPFIRDTDASYPDAEWTSEIQRLSHDPATGHRFRQGDLIRVIANRTLDFAGKRNVNEAHERSPDANWHIELVEANYGLPAPEVVSLSQLVRPDDGNPTTSEAIFDATRQSGPEHWQSMRIRINGLSLTDASGWDKTPFFERICIATDGAGRTFRLRVPLLDLGSAPQGRFDAIGILDQDSGSGVDGTTGYELFVQSIVRTAPVLSILRRDGNSMTLAWPTGAGSLRRTDHLGGVWVPVSETPTTEGANQVLTVPVGDGQAFYRLD